jgi:hypothetical protein
MGTVMKARQIALTVALILAAATRTNALDAEAGLDAAHTR